MSGRVGSVSVLIFLTWGFQDFSRLLYLFYVYFSQITIIIKIINPAKLKYSSCLCNIIF